MTDAVVVSEDRLLGSALAMVLPRRSSVTSVRWLPAVDVDCIEDLVSSLAILDVGPTAGHECDALVQAGVRSVLVLHDKADGALLTACLEAGATGFVTKSASLSEFANAVEALLRGEATIPGGMLGGLLRTLIDRRRADDAVIQRYERLSARERQTLALIAIGHDRASIAEALFISPQTARTHIQNVLTKLEVHSQLEAANFAHEHGYLDGGRA